MMTGFDTAMNGGGWFMAIVLAGSAVAIAWFLVALSRSVQDTASVDPATVLKERLARGDIDVNEYEQARRLLSK